MLKHWRRTKREYQDHLRDENTGIQYEWDGESGVIDAVILGPEESPYEGGFFKVKIILP